MNVRIGTWRDASTVHALRMELERQGSEQTGIPTDYSEDAIARSYAETLHWFYDAQKLVLVAVDDDDKIQGYTLLQEQLYVGRYHGISFPGTIVRESAKRSSAFLRLGNAVYRLLKRYRVPCVQVCVNLNHPKMINFYRKLGFHPVAMVLHRNIDRKSVV